MPKTSNKTAAAANKTEQITLTAEEVKRFTFLSSAVLLGKCASSLIVNKNAKDLVNGIIESIAVITVLDLGTTLAKKRKSESEK